MNIIFGSHVTRYSSIGGYPYDYIYYVYTAIIIALQGNL